MLNLVTADLRLCDNYGRGWINTCAKNSSPLQFPFPDLLLKAILPKSLTIHQVISAWRKRLDIGRKKDMNRHRFLGRWTSRDSFKNLNICSFSDPKWFFCRIGFQPWHLFSTLFTITSNYIHTQQRHHATASLQMASTSLWTGSTRLGHPQV